jgi:hypothetical protein
MKATLEFDFNDENSEDRIEHARMLKSNDLCFVLNEMNQYFRDRLKYTETFETGEIELENAQKRFHELMHDNNINLEEIWR